MTEGAQTPKEIFETAEPALLQTAEQYLGARSEHSELKSALRVAETRERDALAIANTQVGATLNAIHDVATPETDPGEYLQYVLNAKYGGQRVGDRVVNSLIPVREALRVTGTPVAIVGATACGIAFGLSAGDIKVRRRKLSSDQMHLFEASSGVQLGIPLRRIISYPLDNSFGRGGDGNWDYYRSDKSHPMFVKQNLGELRHAMSLEEVQQMHAAEQRAWREYDYSSHHERDVKASSGYVPFVAIGSVAVGEVLRSLYNNEGIASYIKSPDQNNVLATGVTLGLKMDAIVGIEKEEVASRLYQAFYVTTTQDVESSISNEVSLRKYGEGIFFGLDKAINNQSVRKFVGIDQSELTDIARRGIEKTATRSYPEQLRHDNPEDIPSYQEREFRLTETEARDKAIALMKSRYKVDVKFDDLASTVVTEVLENQLASKIEAAKARAEREHERSGRRG